MTREFLFIIAAVFTLLIVLMAASFHLVMNKNTDVIRRILVNSEAASLKERSSSVIRRLEGRRHGGVGDFPANLRKSAENDSGILRVILFSRTADDDYFRVQEILTFDRQFPMDAELKSVVALGDRNEYLKEGLYKPTVDPAIYASGRYSWRMIHHPYRLNNRNLVITFLYSAERTTAALADYDESIRKIKRIVIIINLAAALIVVFVVFVFVQNYTHLLKQLAGYLVRASRGDLGVSIAAPHGDELSELADSFNSLMEEMRELREQGRRSGEADPLDEIFKTGVVRLKEGNTGEAIPLFRSLQILRPESFGSHFNLGVAYARLRRYGESLEMFEKALQINPGHELARQYLEKVKRIMGHPAAGHEGTEPEN